MERLNRQQHDRVIKVSGGKTWHHVSPGVRHWEEPGSFLQNYCPESITSAYISIYDQVIAFLGIFQEKWKCMSTKILRILRGAFTARAKMQKDPRYQLIGKWTVLYLYNVIVLNSKKEQTINTINNIDESQKHYAEWKKCYIKDILYLSIHRSFRTGKDVGGWGESEQQLSRGDWYTGGKVPQGRDRRKLSGMVKFSLDRSLS